MNGYLNSKKKVYLDRIATIVRLSENDGNLTNFRKFVMALSYCDEIELSRITFFHLNKEGKVIVTTTRLLEDGNDGEPEDELLEDFSLNEIKAMYLMLRDNLDSNFKRIVCDKLLMLEEFKKAYPNAEIVNINQHEIHLYCDFAVLRPSTLEDMRKKLNAKDIYVTYLPCKHIKAIPVVAEF